MNDELKPPELLPLRRMASRLGVPSKWLKECAECGQVPGLLAGNRWLFRPDVVVPVVGAMAERNGEVVNRLLGDANSKSLSLTIANKMAEIEVDRSKGATDEPV